jgi:hypothetical protein
MDEITGIQKALRVVSEYHGLDYGDLVQLVDMVLRLDKERERVRIADENEGCMAFVKHATGVCRCSRSPKLDGFCKTHYDQKTSGTLQHGYKKPTMVSFKHTKRIHVNNAEYCYDPISRRVYTVPENHVSKYVGVLRQGEDGIFEVV